MTHDYKRNGTTTLFAALNVLDGSVIGRNMQRHRHQEFIHFLNQNERDVPAGKVIHVILDNYCTHKHAKVKAWLERHPRWTFHFIPTSSSWLNAVEGFCSTQRRQPGILMTVHPVLAGTMMREVSLYPSCTTSFSLLICHTSIGGGTAPPNQMQEGNSCLEINKGVPYWAWDSIRRQPLNARSRSAAWRRFPHPAPLSAARRCATRC
jgi:hypothetical protein